MLIDDAARIIEIAGLSEAAALRAPIPRFSISDGLLPTINELAQDVDALEKSRPHLFMPSPQMWIEMMAPMPERAKKMIAKASGRNNASVRVGAMLYADDEQACTGEALLVTRLGRRADPMISHATMRLGERGVAPIEAGAFLDIGAGARVVDMPPDAMKRFIMALSEQFSKWLIAAVALINTPRIANFVPQNFDDHNYGAPRPGRWPLMAYTDVRLNADVHNSIKKMNTHSIETHTARHHVRAHLRIRLGPVELVRAHWRGNPAFGTKIPAYTVGLKRGSDEQQ